MKASVKHMTEEEVNGYVNLYISNSVYGRYPFAILAVSNPSETNWLAGLSPLEHILTILKLVHASAYSEDEAFTDTVKIKFVEEACRLTMRDIQLL